MRISLENKMVLRESWTYDVVNSGHYFFYENRHPHQLQ